jgi:hypothetical protein
MSESQEVLTAVVDGLAGIRGRVNINGSWVSGIIKIVQCGRENHPKVGEEVSLYTDDGRTVSQVKALKLSEQKPYIIHKEGTYRKRDLMEYRYYGLHKVLDLDCGTRIWSNNIFQDQYLAEDWGEDGLGELFG